VMPLMRFHMRESAFLYNYRGLAYYNLGEKQNAISNFNYAIKLIPTYADAYNNRGNAYSDLGEKQKALEDFQKAAELYKQQENQDWFENSLDTFKEW